MNGINHEIFYRLDLHRLPQKDLCFVLDDTILQKAGRKIENVTYVHDHNLGRSVLGFCVVALGLFTGNAFYTLDHAYFFSNKWHAKIPEKSEIQEAAVVSAVMKQSIVPNWSWPCP